MAEVISKCRRCGGIIGWIDCPTGGWWAHERHPDDDHDAEPDMLDVVHVVPGLLRPADPVGPPLAAVLAVLALIAFAAYEIARWMAR